MVGLFYELTNQRDNMRNHSKSDSPSYFSTEECDFTTIIHEYDPGSEALETHAGLFNP